jgi:lipopolysaccharide/colanic/teichoic acid biosynthesis glycosyltransferase
MTDKRDEHGELLPDEVRLTKFGKLLRSTSLDELPELFNILKGDMAIVGPRPLLVQYLPLYNSRQRHRHDVRPGLTGLAQISGRNAISWEDRFDYDVEYVGNIDFLGDMKIILCTIKKVFIRDGINSETAATMEYFLGNNIKEKR